MSAVENKLKNITIAVSESRQLDIMARLLENRGAKVLRAPLVAIHDAPDPKPVLAWMKGFIADPPTLLIILTGEGLRRLLALAERNSLRDSFIAALSQVKTLCRGPKPNRVLRELGLESSIQAQEATTSGIIMTLDSMPIEHMTIAVQLYGENPNLTLMDYLNSRDVEISRVSPYIYADEADEAKVVELIASLDNGEVDVMAFTSQPQFQRLQQVAKANELAALLLAGLAKVKVAAVGPLVKQQLEEAGVKVDIMPERAFFMKPLVTAIMKACSIAG